MANTLSCWKCGGSLEELSLPLSRRAECPSCHAELHVCRLCIYFNPRVSDKCDESQGEHPREMERANFCDYFKPSPDAYTPPDSSRSQATRNQLDTLFGGASESDKQPAEDDVRKKIDTLFDIKSNKGGQPEQD